MNENTPRLISIKEAGTITSMSRSLIHCLIRDGDFPRPVQLGQRRFAFVRSEVQAWIDARIAGRAA